MHFFRRDLITKQLVEITEDECEVHPHYRAEFGDGFAVVEIY